MVQFYEQNRENYPGGFTQSRSVIERRLQSDRREVRLREYVAELRSGANVEIDEKALREAGPDGSESRS